MPHNKASPGSSAEDLDGTTPGSGSLVAAPGGTTAVSGSAPADSAPPPPAGGEGIASQAFAGSNGVATEAAGADAGDGAADGVDAVAGTAPPSDGDDDDEGSAPHPLLLVPRRHTKLLYLVRHAEGTHNVAGRVLGDASYRDESYADAHLTPRGWRQAARLRAHVTALGTAFAPPEVVIVSPLARTLETAAIVFGGAGEWAPEQGKPLMSARSEMQGLRPAAAAIPAVGAPPFVADERCREQAGVHPCDRRRGVAHYAAQFPAVDFTAVPTEDDELWQPNAREPRAAVRARARALARALLARPERVLAVVSHCGFLHHFGAAVTRGAPPAARGEAIKWFANAELRAVVLADAGTGAGGADPDWHEGGDAVPLDDAYVRGCAP